MPKVDPIYGIGGILYCIFTMGDEVLSGGRCVHVSLLCNCGGPTQKHQNFKAYISGPTGGGYVPISTIYGNYPFSITSK